MYTEIRLSICLSAPYSVGWHHFWLVNNAGLGAWGASIFDTLYANGPSTFMLSSPL